MERSGFISYGKSEKEIVRMGLPAIRAVLLGPDAGAKRRLLLALDWFMDPYYQQDILDIRDGLAELLQQVVVSAGDLDAAEDALGLLGDYEWPPFPILEQNFDHIPDPLKSCARSVISMDRDLD